MCHMFTNSIEHTDVTIKVSIDKLMLSNIVSNSKIINYIINSIGCKRSCLSGK